MRQPFSDTCHPIPLVSIGLPVRNGAAHIAQAIESLLAQTLDDFELTVHDNASTDNTNAIVSAIAQRDPRVRIVRHAQNIGGAANFIHAAEHATGAFFCWAAHDDLREPTFLQTLFDLLQRHPDAALACCAVRNIDPDGTPCDIRPETNSLRNTPVAGAARRLCMYLRETPGTPFYGLFRTDGLHRTLDTLRELDRLGEGGGGKPRPAILGIDMIFLARFLRDHGIAYTRQPLLLFRRGGISHNLGRYGSSRGYLRQLWLYCRHMKRATTAPDLGAVDRLRTTWARWRSHLRWMLSRDMRRMSAHYISHSIPLLQGPRTWLAVRFDRALRRLQRRAADLPPGSRIVLFGAGKHTRRRLPQLRRAVRTHASIVAACDDRAGDCESIPDLPVIPPARLPEQHANVLLVSSDTYEGAMHGRACEVAPPEIKVWTLYDRSLEESAVVRRSPLTAVASSASTSAMNLAISTSESKRESVPVASVR